MSEGEQREGVGRLSVVIPARDEEENIVGALRGLLDALSAADIPAELVVVDDGSRDRTAARVEKLASSHPEVRLVPNGPPHGFGLAVRKGLSAARGDAVIAFMGDGSDAPEDVVALVTSLGPNVDMAFGSRFLPEAHVHGYPIVKLMANRMGNRLIGWLTGVDYDDFTNPLKCYRREVIQAIGQLDSTGFELSLELSLRAVGLGRPFTVVPTDWIGRDTGASKFRVFREAARYLSVVWDHRDVWLRSREHPKHLSRRFP